MQRNTRINRRAASRMLLPLGLLLAVLLTACAQVRLPDAAPDIASFTASPAALTAGEESTLAWEVTGADYVTLLPFEEEVDSEGTRTVSPEETTGYTLVAVNKRGESREELTIQVRQPEDPPAIAFDADPAEIAPGETSLLTWDVAGADTITISPDIGTVPEKMSSRSVAPASTTTYRLTASNQYGDATAKTTVTVTTGDSDGRPVIAGFAAEPEGIELGESSTLSWDVEGATSVSIHPGIGDVQAEDSTDVTPSETTTYTLRAANADGVTARNVTVHVRTDPDSAPLVARFSASPSSVGEGELSTLRWVVVGADSVEISPDIGTVSANSSRAVQVDEDTTYTLTATNSNGTTERTATVTVEDAGTDPDAAVTALFLADPASGTAPLGTEFHWVISDPGGRVTAVDLDTGDGESASDLDSEEGNYSYTYDNEGVYTAELSVRLADGSTIQRSATVAVSDGQAGGTAPDIDQFQATPGSGAAPLNVAFSWDVSGGSDLICTIDAGDGSAPETVTDCESGEYTHSYQEPGVYVPSLTVQDGDGNVATAATAVTVFPASGGSGLIEAFTAEPDHGDLPLETDFSWELSGSADAWLFFGDGSTPRDSSGATGTATHTYEDGGTFRAVLLAVDANGDADVALLPIRVVDPALVPTAVVRTGSTTLALDADERGLLAPLLGTLLPDGADLTVLDNAALLDTDVNLFGLLEAVALNAGSGGLEAVLLGAVDLTDVIDGLLDLVAGTSAVAPLEDLLGLLPTEALPVELGDLINVVDLDDLVNLKEINLQVLDVLVLALQLFNSESVASTPEPIELGLAGAGGLLDVLGLGSLVSGTLDSGSLAKVYLQVVEPPVITLARVDRLGEPDASFRSAGVRLALELEGLGLSLDLDDDSAPDGLLDGLVGLITGLLSGLDILNIDLSLTLTELTVFAEVGAFDGHVSDIDLDAGTVTVQSAGSVANLALGQIDHEAFFDRSRTTPVEADYGTIVDAELNISAELLGALPLAGANVGITVGALANTGANFADSDLVLSAPFPTTASAPSYGAGDLVDGLLATLDLQLELDVSTSGALSGLLGLNDLLEPLEDLITDVLESVLNLGDSAGDLGTSLPLGDLLTELLDNTVFEILGVNLNETEVTVLDLVTP